MNCRDFDIWDYDLWDYEILGLVLRVLGLYISVFCFFRILSVGTRDIYKLVILDNNLIYLIRQMSNIRNINCQSASSRDKKDSNINLMQIKKFIYSIIERNFTSYLLSVIYYFFVVCYIILF